MFVLDSSIALTWYLPDENNAAARELRERVIEAGAIVPPHWQLEVGNALLMAMRRKRISEERRREALEQLIDLQITTDDKSPDHLWTRSLDLADAHRLTLYDACYLELAQRRRLPLATLDQDLRNAAAALDIALLGA